MNIKKKKSCAPLLSIVLSFFVKLKKKSKL